MAIAYNYIMAGLVAVVYTPTAHAYIDPGTGALVVQAAIGAAVTALVTIKYWWSKAIKAFRGLIAPR